MGIVAAGDIGAGELGSSVVGSSVPVVAPVALVVGACVALVVAAIVVPGEAIVSVVGSSVVLGGPPGAPPPPLLQGDGMLSTAPLHTTSCRRPVVLTRPPRLSVLMQQPAFLIVACTILQHARLDGVGTQAAVMWSILDVMPGE